MSIDPDLEQLQEVSDRLKGGSQWLDDLIHRIDSALHRLSIRVDYTHTRPLAEQVERGADGKRRIELSYLAYASVAGSRRLAIKTIKVLESKAALDTTDPRRIVPLRDAPVALRHAAVEQMAEALRGMTAHLKVLADRVDARCDSAESVLHSLERHRVSTPGIRTPRKHGPRPAYPRLKSRTQPPLVLVTRAAH
ncbi:MAG: hypothetical protein V3V08_09265 [Nannocystaceae bacterium]